MLRQRADDHQVTDIIPGEVNPEHAVAEARRRALNVQIQQVGSITPARLIGGAVAVVVDGLADRVEVKLWACWNIGFRT